MYGTANGTTTSQVYYSFGISNDTPIVKKTKYKYPHKGIVNFKIRTLDFTLDYSPDNESDDSIAELEIIGNKKTIDLEPVE